MLDLSLKEAEAVAASLTHGVALSCDVTAADQVNRVLDAFGDIDVLVNNAGILRPGPLIDHDPDDFSNYQHQRTRFRRSGRSKKDAGKGGSSIVNMASIVGIHPNPNNGAYAAAKGGVLALTQRMSMEWGRYGIRVNAVAPASSMPVCQRRF